MSTSIQELARKESIMMDNLPNPYYHQLDRVADSFTPLLLLLVVLLMAKLWWQQRCALAYVWRTVASVMWVAFVSYGGMALDKALNLWPKWHMDYSTHTSVAGGLSVLAAMLMVCLYKVSRTHPAPSRTGLSKAWLTAMSVSSVFSLTLGYFALMVYQQYHSVEDIATTFIATASLIYWGVTTFLEPLYGKGFSQKTLKD